ncbi:MAG: TIM barrel protein [Bacteroidales bacterium]
MQRLALAIIFGIFLLQSALCQNPDRFQNEIDQFKADTTEYSAIDRLVLFTGSSTVRIWTDLPKDFPDLVVLNRGFGGSHMSDLLYYVDTLILQYRPVKIFIYEGDNDIASGKGPDEILDSAGKLVELIRQKLPGSTICFISAKPSIARWHLKETYSSFNKLLKEFTLNYSNVYYLDVWNKMIDIDGKPKSDLFFEDGLHLNRKGYDIWKEVVGEFLNIDLSGQPVVFGVCTSMANAGRLKDSGFGYVEGSVGRDLMPGRPDEEFAKKLAEFDTCLLPVIACNGFLPGTLKVTGPDARPDTVLRYAEVAFRRAASVGIRTIVFGSSGARSIPEGFDRQQAREQFISLLKEMGPIARKYGVTVAIENLQKSETNFINTVGEALSIAREVNDPNIRVLADIFHMMREKEGPEALLEAGDYLVHCHIAEIRDRTAPGMAGDDFRPYFAALKKIGYRGGISIEGSWKSENLPKAFQVLKDQWETNQ